jgi:tRNA(Ile)-lysidine synthase
MLPVQFIEILEHECQVKPGMRILVGVSGGADSICLLDLFQQSGYPMLVAHFNHKLRKEAEDDLFFVRNLARLRNLHFVQGEGNVKDFAKKNRKTLEEAARICRYEFLKREANKNGIGIVAVAHTATDQAETILMHLLRGCGLDGLQGMLPVSLLNDSPQIRLIRPLLSFWKEDILTYCAKNNLEFRDDQTNFDPGYFRNRLRLKLMPILREYNSNIEKHLINLGKISNRELRLINQSVIRSYQLCLVEEKSTYINLSKTALLNVENGMLQRVLQLAFHKLTSRSIELNFYMVEKMTCFVRKPNGKNHLSLPSSIELIIEGDYVYFHHRKTALPSQNYPFMDPKLELNVDVPTEIKVNPKWTMKTFLVPFEEIKFPKDSTSLILEAFLDEAKISWPMILKCQQPGVRFEPLGLHGKTQKLSDFWINKKIPHRFRSSWPLLFDGEEIAWIPGFQPAHKFKITGETRRAVKIEFTNR